MKLGVFGGDLSQSFSEELHTYFGKTTGREVDFHRIQVSAEGFEEAFRSFFASGGHGASITAPFKEQVAELLDEVRGLARRVSSVNCVHNDNGQLIGYNTDGPGVVSALHNYHGLDVRDRRVIVLGTGGVAAGIIGELQTMGAQGAAVWGRSRESVRRFTKAIGATDQVEGFYDLVVHATSAPDPFDVSWLEDFVQPTSFVYDVQYIRSGRPTWFCEWASSKGLQSASGLSMLIEQGALAFEIWTGELVELTIRKNF